MGGMGWRVRFLIMRPANPLPLGVHWYVQICLLRCLFLYATVESADNKSSKYVVVKRTLMNCHSL